MQFETSIIGISVLLLAGCGGGDTGSAPITQETVTQTPVVTNIQDTRLSLDPAPLDLTCKDYDEYSTSVFRYANNVWNKQAAGSYAYVQCLRQRGSITTKEFGWRWQWPSNSVSVFGYPAIYAGWKPWNGGQSTTPLLPIRIKSITQFKWAYTVETATNGKYNLSTSLWLTSNGSTFKETNSKYVTTEFMIWSSDIDFSPAGTMLGYSIIDSVPFEVWFKPDQVDASNQNTNVWKYVAYRSTVPLSTATLDIKKIVDDAASRGIVNRDDYISSLELGNEVMSGTGETWVKSAVLDIR